MPALPPWQKTNLTLNRGFEWPGCDVKSNSLKLLSGQAHASPMLDQIRVPVGTYGMAQQSSAALEDLTPVLCTCKERGEHYLQKMACPREAMAGEGSLPAGRWKLG